MNSVKVLANLFKTPKKTSGSDYTATVTRVDGNTAYVQLTGSEITDTPVSMTVNASPGDKVRVRIANGKAWLTGSDSAPPTNDAYAKRVSMKLTKEIESTNVVVRAVDKVVQAVKKIADNTNQYFWHTETGTDTGAHITEIPQDEFLADPDNGGGNLLARSNGIAVRDGLQELASFSAGGMAISGVNELGRQINIAHLGYGGTNGENGSVEAPFYMLGPQAEYSYFPGYDNGIGRFSLIEGAYNIASAAYSHCEGTNSEAHGYASHAQNMGTVAASRAQTAMGKYNELDASDVYALIVGNGSNNGNRSNALTLDWNGALEVADPDTTRLNFGIAAGLLAGSSVPAHSYVDYTITFGKTFPGLPTIVVGFASDSTGVDMGSFSCSSHSRTRTGCKVRVFNNSSSARAPYISWIAIG